MIARTMLGLSIASAWDPSLRGSLILAPDTALDCPVFEQPEPAADTVEHDTWLYDRARAAEECRDHATAADAYGRVVVAATAHGTTDLRGLATVGLARAWFQSTRLERRDEQLARARQMLEELLGEADPSLGHHPETLRFAARLLEKIDAELAHALPSPVPTVESAAASGPSTAVAARLPDHDGEAHEGRTQRPPSAIAGVVMGGVALSAGIGLAAAAIGLRPWYGRRYHDESGYTVEVARELTRPWVIGYAVGAAFGTVTGTILLAVFSPRLRGGGRTRRRTGPRGSRGALGGG